MPARKQLQTNLKPNPELERLLEETRSHEITEEELREQRVSFAFGNAPPSDFITKETVRYASKHVRLRKS